MGIVRLGNDRLLWVRNAAGTNFIPVEGQGNLSRSRSRSTFSTASKTSSWDTEGVGKSKGEVSVDFKPEFPNTAWDLLEARCRAEPQAAFDIQVRNGGLNGTGADVIYAVTVMCSQISDDDPQNDVSSTKITLLPQSAPTTDKLA